jgi:hypothetical protein
MFKKLDKVMFFPPDMQGEDVLSANNLALPPHVNRRPINYVLWCDRFADEIDVIISAIDRFASTVQMPENHVRVDSGRLRHDITKYLFSTFDHDVI